jgi:tetratricopeptide (TPR) repeat protein
MKRYPSKALPLTTYAWLANELLRAGNIARAGYVCDVLIERAGSQARYRAFAQFTQARCDAALGKWDEAASILQDLVKEGALDASCGYAAERLLADGLHELGKDSQAEELLHHIASQSSGRAAAEAEAALAQRLHDMGRPSEAAAVYRHFLLIFDTPTTRDLVAAGYAGLATCEDEMGHRARSRLARARLAEMSGSDQ